MNGHNLSSFSSLIFGNNVQGHDCLKMRETILEHESVFRYQLTELHRLYRRQKELMDETRRGNGRHLAHEKGFSVVPRGSYDGNTELFLHTVQKFPSIPNAVTLDLVSKSFPQNSRDVTNWGNARSFTVLQGKESTQRQHSSFADERACFRHDVGEFFPGNSSTFLHSQNAERRLLAKVEPVSVRKRKLFGVEISEPNEVSLDSVLGVPMSSTKDGIDQESQHPASCVLNSLVSKSELEGNAVQGCSTVKSNLLRVLYPKEEGPKNCDESFPWFLKKLKEQDDLNKGVKSSYFMNLESLQNSTRGFFKKAEPDNTLLKNEILAECTITNTEIRSGKCNDSISDRLSEGCFPCGDAQRSKARTTESRCNIDLNLSLDEEDLPPAHCISATVLKVAATGIDLEAPVECHSDLCTEEVDRLAAESIIAFSLHKAVDVNVDDVDADDLKWFAELIFSEFSETGTSQIEEEAIPDGMDHFEFVTLKLEDCKNKHYDYQPIIFEDEKETDNISTRSRRHSKRGKPRKDFQRDILPGLVTLSRLQVSEDLHSFEELMKAQGKAWHSGLSQRGATRNNRGKKRTITPETPPKTKLSSSSNASPQKPLWQLQERSLTGWGKRTRRLPRQRCPNGFVTFPIKC